MRSIELHGERRGWNPHFVTRVVRNGQVFLEVWIFRDVRHQFLNFITHALSALPAIGENGVARKNHGSARLVMVANLIDARVFHQFSGSQRAV
jgi:hypothetical protein